MYKKLLFCEMKDMNRVFFAPDTSDKRIAYAAEELVKRGFKGVKSEGSADFILLGVNPDKSLLDYNKPIFAGNVSKDGVIDYTKDEAFALENAYLTAEGAISEAVRNSDNSLINSDVLITGLGRISKALVRYTEPYTKNITVCARSGEAIVLAETLGADTITFDKLKCKNIFDFIFNTVPHPVFNEAELKALKKDAVIIDLASFPGGVDRKFAEYLGLNLIIARSLPAKCSPKSAGVIVAKTVERLLKEVTA